MIIGLAGRAGSGKSTIAHYLVEKYGFIKYSFAEPLKQMLLKAGMCSYDELYGNKTANSRWLMQKIGTEIFRKQVDPEFWIKKAHENLFELIGENIVIDDVRFPEEADWICDGCMNIGFIVKVIRKDYLDAHAGTVHDSERLLDRIDTDFKICAASGDIEGLKQQADKIIEKLCTFIKRGVDIAGGYEDR